MLEAIRSSATMWTSCGNTTTEEYLMRGTQRWGFDVQLDHLLACVRGDEQPHMSARDALASQRLAEQIRSAGPADVARVGWASSPTEYRVAVGARSGWKPDLRCASVPRDDPRRRTMY